MSSVRTTLAEYVQSFSVWFSDISQQGCRRQQTDYRSPHPPLWRPLQTGKALTTARAWFAHRVTHGRGPALSADVKAHSKVTTTQPFMFSGDFTPVKT